MLGLSTFDIELLSIACEEFGTRDANRWNSSCN